MPDQTIKCPKCGAKIQQSFKPIDMAANSSLNENIDNKKSINVNPDCKRDEGNCSDSVITQKLENYRYFHQFLVGVTSKCLMVSGMMFVGFSWCYKNLKGIHWAGCYSLCAAAITVSLFFMINRGITLTRNTAVDAGKIKDFNEIMNYNKRRNGWTSRAILSLLIAVWLLILYVTYKYNDPFFLP